MERGGGEGCASAHSTSAATLAGGYFLSGGRAIFRHGLGNGLVLGGSGGGALELGAALLDVPASGGGA